MAVKTVDSRQARNNWREMLDTVMAEDIDIVVTRYNKPVITMLSYEDYVAIQEQLIEVRRERHAQQKTENEAVATMVATERVLSRDWETPEEDAAWADL
jgi:prevent-host-death family protein